MVKDAGEGIRATRREEGIGLDDFSSSSLLPSRALPANVGFLVHLVGARAIRGRTFMDGEAERIKMDLEGEG